MDGSEFKARKSHAQDSLGTVLAGTTNPHGLSILGQRPAPVIKDYVVDDDDDFAALADLERAALAVA